MTSFMLVFAKEGEEEEKERGEWRAACGARCGDRKVLIRSGAHIPLLCHTN